MLPTKIEISQKKCPLRVFPPIQCEKSMSVNCGEYVISWKKAPAVRNKGGEKRDLASFAGA
jgi:hypothetical protein